jgi:hypothetical protein
VGSGARARCLLAILVALSGSALVGEATAQATTSWIVITEPGEWGDNRALVAAVGTRIRVVGQAFHSGGIAAITIDGQAATIRAAAGGVMDFEGYLTISSGESEVAIEARPQSGTPLRRMFGLLGTGGAPPPPPPIIEEPPVAVAYSPGGAAVRSLFIPGLGQVYTKRPALGILFIGAAGGAAAFGILSKETTVRCLAPLASGTCPSGQEHSRVEDTPYLIPGIAAAAGIAAIAAIEAFTAAKRLNRESGLGSRPDGSWLAQSRPLIGVSRNGLVLGVRVAP